METGTHKYVYGKAYHLTGEISEDEVRVYFEIRDSDNFPINSLEGIFESFKPVAENLEEITPGWRCIIDREEMNWFEDKYNGKFKPFKKKGGD